MKTILALIGVGEWGQKYIKTCKESKTTTLRYICTRSPKTVKRYIDEFITVNDYHDLFPKHDIDGIIIATPAETHYQIAKECIERQYPILIEKPVTLSVQECDALKKLQKNIAMVDHIYLYNPAFCKFERLLKTIQPVSYVEMSFTDWKPLRHDVNLLWDWGPHPVSIAVRLFGLPRSVSILNQVYANSQLVIVEFMLSYNRTNVKCTLASSCPEQKRECIAYGKSMIRFDDRREKKITIFDPLVPDIKTKQSIRFSQFSAKNPLLHVIDEFVSSIRKRKAPYSDLHFSLQVTEVLDRLQKKLPELTK